MLIDFHTHTTASDGALSPSQLLLRAVDRGVEALALTDHDTLSGWRATQSLQSNGITLVCGVELSCQWGGATIHVVGLNVNANADPLIDMIDHLQRLRGDRAVKIAAKLEQLGAAGALVGAQALAGDGAICRPHFAHWLVAEGHMPSVSRAFDKWLGNGKPGDIKTLWPNLAETIAVIVAAGADSLVVGRATTDDVEVVLFVELAPTIVLDDGLRQRIRQAIRSNTTPRHVPSHILEVAAIPYTRSGKKVELAVTQILRGEAPQNLSALANAECLEQYRLWAEHLNKGS